MLSMSDSQENRLGAIAATINSPINWDTPGKNPTNLIATAASPISLGAASSIKNTYHTALGNPNTGPRIDDNNSLLYTIDFCYQGAKAANPFSDPTFANRCGICMTQGTLINGTSGSNLGVVVFPEDRAYSLSQGIDAVPSSHSATCAPIVKSAGASSNIRSVAVNSEQYTETKAYMLSNFYTIDGGSGAGEKNVKCAGSSNGHTFVIKQGAYRDGIWDSHVAGAPIDYSRKNLLTTTPFPSTCIEQSNCVFTTSSLQWDSASLCGYPKPTPLTSLGVDSTQTTATSLTFVWAGGEYADNAQYSLVKQSDSSTVPGIQGTLNLSGKSVKYIGLTANTVYVFSLTVSNAAGIAQGSYTTSGFKNFVEGFFDTVTGRVEGQTADDRDKVSGLAITNQMQTSFSVSWTGGKNASSITVSLSDPTTNTQVQSMQIAPGATVCPFTGLVAGKTYTVMVTATYNDGPSVSISGTAQTTSPPPPVYVPPPPPPSLPPAVNSPNVTAPPPTNVSATFDPSSFTVSVRWTPPDLSAMSNTSISIYILYQKETNTTMYDNTHGIVWGIGNDVKTLNPGTTSAIIDGETLATNNFSPFILLATQYDVNGFYRSTYVYAPIQFPSNIHQLWQAYKTPAAQLAAANSLAQCQEDKAACQAQFTNMTFGGFAVNSVAADGRTLLDHCLNDGGVWAGGKRRCEPDGCHC